MTPQEICNFWLDEVGPEGWYTPSEGLDDQIRARFAAAWEDAESLTAQWRSTPRGALAALILTDQFPRNMFRGDGRSFATDAFARRIATQAISDGHDLAITGPARQFFYLPFMHSEDMADQDRSVALFVERHPGDNVRHAELHRDIIRRFGRFPFRNKALGRETTPEEQAFLDAGAYGAMLRGELSLAEGR